MIKDKFKIEEIITIIMERVRCLENEELYGISLDEELPQNINDKINELSEKNYKDFEDKINNISEEILLLKSGELNELNEAHKEILFLAIEKLQSYILI